MSEKLQHKDSLIFHRRVQFLLVFHSIRLWKEMFKNFNTLKHVKLAAILSRLPVTVELTFTEQANSYDGHYSIIWPHVYLEAWSPFHI